MLLHQMSDVELRAAVRRRSAAGTEPTTAEESADSEDRPLVRASVAGDSSAYGELVRRHEPDLRRVVLGLVADRHLADDVLQEVFLAAYRGLPRFRGDGTFGAWIYRIAVREALRARSRMRRLWRVFLPLDSRDPLVREDPARPHDSVDALDEALGLLAQLPRRQRIAFVLHVVEDCSYAEVADLLGCSPGTVGSLIHRARERLRAISSRGSAPHRAGPAGVG